MFWSKRKNEAPIIIQPPVESRVEVEIAKDASKEAAEKAKNANEHLKELLVNNGFTLKIYLAAHTPNTKQKQGRT